MKIIAALFFLVLTSCSSGESDVEAAIDQADMAFQKASQCERDIEDLEDEISSLKNTVDDLESRLDRFGAY